MRTMPGVVGDRRLEGELVAADERGVVVAAPDLPEGSRRLAYGDIERAHRSSTGERRWRARLPRLPGTAGAEAQAHSKRRSVQSAPRKRWRTRNERNEF